MGASEKGEGKEAKGPRKAAGLQGAPSATLLAALLRTAWLTPLFLEKIYLYWPEVDFTPPAFIRDHLLLCRAHPWMSRMQAESLRGGCQLL